MHVTRRALIAANWKMNPMRDEAYALMGGILKEVESHDSVDVLICPPSIYLEVAVQMMKDTPLFVGAQNLHHEESGPYTGEVSGAMLQSIGCSHVIVGHSERRTLFDECNAEINSKLKACLDCGMMPILCVGETHEQRSSGRAFDVLTEQLTYGLQGIDGSAVGNSVIAYEPVWAIGTGVSATSTQVEEVHQFIRDTIGRFTDEDTAQTIRIIYGGSVNPDNAPQLLSCPNVDGALIGGASLKLDAFCGIVRTAVSLSQQPVTLSRGQQG
jgi:triosephosphate isomerase